MVTVGDICAPLFVPASRPERYSRAAGSGADAVILDLEVAVALADKDAARSLINPHFTHLPVLVRINPVNTQWFEADLSAVRGHGFAGVILPKAEDAGTVAQIAAALGATPLIALVETAPGLAGARAVAACGVARLAFGSVDFCADIGCAHEAEALLPVRCELVLASRLAGIAPPLDGVTLRIDSPEQARDDARHARKLGMSGKLCIHPRQTGPVREAFLPTPEETKWARRVLASGDGAAAVDGAMVDEPVRRRARAILAGAPC
jgi:citrate lyase subunit beta/citryl-CoA lyase